MKKYNTPRLTTHGSVEKITKELGNEDLADTIFNNTGETVRGVPPGSQGPGDGGSQDAIIEPGGPA